MKIAIDIASLFRFIVFCLLLLFLAGLEQALGLPFLTVFFVFKFISKVGLHSQVWLYASAGIFLAAFYDTNLSLPIVLFIAFGYLQEYVARKKGSDWGVYTAAGCFLFVFALLLHLSPGITILIQGLISIAIILILTFIWRRRRFQLSNSHFLPTL